MTANEVINNGLSGVDIGSQHDCIVEGNIAVSSGVTATVSHQRTGIAITVDCQDIVIIAETYLWATTSRLSTPTVPRSR